MSEWVSVKDRLPEKSGRYLVYYKYHIFDDIYGEYFAVVYYSAKHEAFNAYDNLDSAEGAIDDFTHWAFLPEPPIE